MSNIINLKGLPVSTRKINEDLVKVLSSALELAKSGELQCFVGTGMTLENERVSIFSIGYGENSVTLYGAVGMLQVELFTRQNIERKARDDS